MNQMSPRICKRVKILAQHRFRTAWRSTGSMACPPVTQLLAWEVADLAAVVASATATDPSPIPIPIPIEAYVIGRSGTVGMLELPGGVTALTARQLHTARDRGTQPETRGNR
jgi:hypothetical protein